MTANKSSNVIRHGEHGLNKFGIEGKISRFEVNIEHLKRRVGRRSRGIAAKLNVTGSKRRKGIIRATEEARKSRGVNNNSAGMITIKIIARDNTIRKGMGKLLIRIEVSFLNPIIS